MDVNNSISRQKIKEKTTKNERSEENKEDEVAEEEVLLQLS
jgi:hypothetical protein